MANLDIPQDIIDCIIEAIGDDKPLLRTCALVSSSFLLPSRKRLFSDISLGSDRACQRLHQLLVVNPIVQSFIRSIHIPVGWPQEFRSARELNKSTSLIAVLRLPFRHLERFSLYSFGSPLSWKDFSSQLKEAHSTIICSASLKSLDLYEVVDLPIVLFQGIHLTNLELHCILPNDFDREQSSLLTQNAPNGGKATTSHAVIDRCAWKYTGSVRGPTAPIFLPFMSHLRVFEIRVCPISFHDVKREFNFLSFVIRSLRVSLASPATLEHLKLEINVYDDGIGTDAFLGALRHDEVWGNLDSIVTHPSGSRLQRVDININYRDDVKVLKIEGERPIHNALPLLREKGILFVTA